MYHIQSKNPVEHLTLINSCLQITKNRAAYQHNHTTGQWISVSKTSKGSEFEQNLFLKQPQNHLLELY